MRNAHATHLKNELNAPDPELSQGLPLNNYLEVIREFLVHFELCYMVFYNNEPVIDALRIALPLERITDIGLNIHVRGDALQASGNCWCCSRRQIVNLNK